MTSTLSIWWHKWKFVSYLILQHFHFSVLLVLKDIWTYPQPTTFSHRVVAALGCDRNFHLCLQIESVKVMHTPIWWSTGLLRLFVLVYVDMYASRHHFLSDLTSKQQFSLHGLGAKYELIQSVKKKKKGGLLILTVAKYCRFARNATQH